MAKPTERERVENPFSMGPSPTNQPGRLMEQKVPLPKAAFQDFDKGTAMVDALVSFAGVGADQYVKRMNKKIEEDKIIQSGLAIAGARPTDDATVVGYRTHAAVTLKSQILESQAKLNQLAQQGLDDDQWDKAVRDEYKRVDKYLLDNYYNYTTDTEMQKLVPISFREAMPQIVATREADKIEREIQTRINDVSDSLISMDTIDAQTGNAIPPDQLAVNMDRLVKGLQLTSSQKDKAVENAIVTSKSLKLIEASKIYKGDRKTSLFDRSAKLQTLEQTLETQQAVNNGIDYEITTSDIYNKAVSGLITDQELVAKVKELRKVSNNKYPPRGFISKTLIDMNKQKLKQAEMIASLTALSNGDVNRLKGKSKKDMDAIVDMSLDVINKSAADEVEKTMPNATDVEKEQAIQGKVIANTKQIIQRSVEAGHVPVSLISKLNQVASLNLTEKISDVQKGKGIKEKLSPEVTSLLTFANSVPVPVRQAVLDSLKYANKRTIELYWNEIGKGTVPALALDRAQTQANNPAPIKSNDVIDSADDIMSSLEFGFWKKDYTGNQESMVKRHIAELLYNSADPTGDATKDQIKEAVKGYARTDKGRVFLGMSDKKVQEMTNVGSSYWDAGINALINNNKDRLLPVLETMGLSIDDVTILPFPAQGYFRLVDPSGALLSTKRFKFSEIGDAYVKNKADTMKRMLDWKKKNIKSWETVPVINTKF